MLSLSGNVEVFVHNQAVDMRKGFEGLWATVDQCMGLEVTSGAYFAFLNRRGDRIKVLYWDGDGLALWYKRLEKGRFIRREDGKVALDRREFLLLLEGVTPKRMSHRYQLGQK